MPEDESQLVAQPRPNLRHDRLSVETIGALVIAIFNQRHRRIDGAKGMVGEGYRRIKFGDFGRALLFFGHAYLLGCALPFVVYWRKGFEHILWRRRCGVGMAAGKS